MKKKKINVGILFGGKSAEHEISLQSAKGIVEAIDKNKYDPVLIRVDKTGRWLVVGDAVALIPQSSGKIFSLSKDGYDQKIDVMFPILHGPFGEDGTVQGLLKLANIPFVGAGVLGSAVGMDKDAMKRLLRDADVPIGKFLAIKIGENIPDYNFISKTIGMPCFVKPANLGSSVGINKATNKSELQKAVKVAFQYDTKIIIEESIDGREIECSVLGNSDPIASIPGEVITDHEFYSYEAKYIDNNGATLEIPAKIPKKAAKNIQNLAIKTFKTLSCEGLGRVDFFLKDNGEIIVNEINTIPGFTKISMYPKLWEASGISYSELIDRLIRLALERFNKEQKLKTSYGK